MNQDIFIGGITVDCDDAAKLSEFYARLLDWEKIDVYGKPGIRNGDTMICFAREEDYVAPVWPEEAGKQQKQIHLDFLGVRSARLRAKGGSPRSGKGKGAVRRRVLHDHDRSRRPSVLPVR